MGKHRVQQARPTDIFISYARADQNLVERLKPVLQRLKVELGVNYFQDLETLRPGEEWGSEIEKSLTEATIYLCFISKHYFASEFVYNHEMPEIERRFQLGWQVLPIRVDESIVESQSALAEAQSINAPSEPVRDMSAEEFTAFESKLWEALEQAVQKYPVHRRRPPRVSYNLVVIGKTGVGKSELINYLFEKVVAESAIGPPITLPIFHRYDLMIAGVPTTLWDSAGLEVGDPKAWLKNLKDELEFRGPTQPIQRWFHTVLYCIQAPGSRVEPYEIDIIRYFRKLRFKVIVVFTKCYIGSSGIKELSQWVHEQLREPLTHVNINSRDEDLQEGLVVRRFGREKLIKEINIALIESLTERIPARCIGFMAEFVDKQCDLMIKYIRDYRKVVSPDHLSHEVGRALEVLLSDVRSPSGHFQRVIRRETRHAVSTYREIAGLLDEVLAAEEELPPAQNESRSKVALPALSRYWKLVTDTWEELYDEKDSRMSKYLGEIAGDIVDGLATTLTFPLALLGGAIEYLEERLLYSRNLIGKVEELREQLKEELQSSETRIRRLFSESVRDL